MGERWQWEQGEPGAVRNGVSGCSKTCLPSLCIHRQLQPWPTLPLLPRPQPPRHLPCPWNHCQCLASATTATHLPTLPLHTLPFAASAYLASAATPTAIRSPTMPLHTLPVAARARPPPSQGHRTLVQAGWATAAGAHRGATHTPFLQSLPLKHLPSLCIHRQLQPGPGRRPHRAIEGRPRLVGRQRQGRTGERRGGDYGAVRMVQHLASGGGR